MYKDGFIWVYLIVKSVEEGVPCGESWIGHICRVQADSGISELILDTLGPIRNWEYLEESLACAVGQYANSEYAIS